MGSIYGLLKLVLLMLFRDKILLTFFSENISKSVNSFSAGSHGTENEIERKTYISIIYFQIKRIEPFFHLEKR